MTAYAAVPALALLCACEPAAEGPVRREPWRKDELALQRTDRPFLRYRAESGQSLSFSIQTKQVHLRGRVPLERAELELDPTGLDASRGSLVFDLEGLTLERVLVGEEGEGAALTGDLLLTEAARLWLSLGPDVGRQERAQRRTAEFEVRLGRALSSHSVQGGSVVSAARAARRAGSVRRVSGLVEGDLLMLGREVTHVMKAEVDFLGPSPTAVYEQPERLVVRLAQPEGVPLAEHGIVPRDARGAVVSEQLAGLGRGALRASVTGSLRFEHQRD